MCRNIKPLFNFEPAVSDDEIRASALQFVRKVSGTTKPSKANEEVFDKAVAEVTRVTRELLESMTTNAPPKDRALVAEQARVRSLKRFGGNEQRVV
jgi:hypothetical protein